MQSEGQATLSPPMDMTKGKEATARVSRVGCGERRPGLGAGQTRPRKHKTGRALVQELQNSKACMCMFK